MKDVVLYLVLTQGGLDEFGLPNVFPISLEKEHGAREYVPPKYAKRAIVSLEELLAYIESKIKNEESDPEDTVLN